MSARDGFTRLLGTWLQEEGVVTRPDYLEQILDRTSMTRQRPAWMSPRRWLPMDTTFTRTGIRAPRLAAFILLATLLIAAVVAGAALYFGSQRALPAYGPAANGQIGFEADGSLSLVAADGTIRAIPLAVKLASGPTFSRDGKLAAFYATSSSTSTEIGLYVGALDGSNVHAIAGNLVLGYDTSAFPVWSPDGRQLVFDAKMNGSDHEIVAAADGSSATALPTRPDEGQSFPAWSPDGQWIGYAGYPFSGDAPSLQVVHPDGTGARVLLTAQAGETVVQDLQWAPDGSGRLLFAIGSDSSNRLVSIDVDDGKQVTVVDRPGIIEFGAAWSPDATRIASNQTDRGSIVVNADGSGLTVLPDARCAGRVEWAPDGTRVMCLDSVALGEDRYELLKFDPNGVAPIERVLMGNASGQSTAMFSWQRVAPASR